MSRKDKEQQANELVQLLYRRDSVPELAEQIPACHFGPAHGISSQATTSQGNNKPRKETVMPLVDIHLIEGAFDKSQKQAMINKVTNAMLEVEGEAMRGVTWVRVYEVASGEWAIGGKALSAADVKAMQTR
jgi:4-oxalocrotonate tautomerase